MTATATTATTTAADSAKTTSMAYHIEVDILLPENCVKYVDSCADPARRSYFREKIQQNTPRAKYPNLFASKIASRLDARGACANISWDGSAFYEREIEYQCTTSITSSNQDLDRLGLPVSGVFDIRMTFLMDWGSEGVAAATFPMHMDTMRFRVPFKLPPMFGEQAPDYLKFPKSTDVMDEEKYSSRADATTTYVATAGKQNKEGTPDKMGISNKYKLLLSDPIAYNREKTVNLPDFVKFEFTASVLDSGHDILARECPSFDGTHIALMMLQHIKISLKSGHLADHMTQYIFGMKLFKAPEQMKVLAESNEKKSDSKTTIEDKDKDAKNKSKNTKPPSGQKGK